MGDTAGNLDSPQVLQDLIDCPPDVQQHRQFELTGEFQLLDKIELLARRVAVGHVEVEADLADGHRLLALQPVAQHGQVGFLRLRHIERMDAVGRDTARVTFDAGFDLAEAVDRNRRHDNARYPSRERRRMHRVTIGIEFGRVEVTVGVDQHPTNGKSGAGRRPLIRSARAAAEPQAMVQPRVPWPVLSHSSG